MKKTVKSILRKAGRLILKTTVVRKIIIKILNKAPRIKIRLRNIVLSDQGGMTYDDLSPKARNVFHDFEKLISGPRI